MIEESLKELLKKAITATTKKTPEKISLETPPNTDLGDFSCNVAMSLSKEEKTNPRELAEKIISNIPENEFIEKTEIAGPGFINLRLSQNAYNTAFKKLFEMVEKKTWGNTERGKGIRVITDSSHPNVAKPMGVHHLLSTILGQSINNLYKCCGYDLIRDNYLGDWGTQFGKLIVAIRNWGNLEEIKKDPISELLKIYVKFHDEAESNPSLEDQGREEFKKLEDGDIENKKLWSWIREVSLIEFNKLWKRLGVDYDMMQGESDYEEGMAEIIHSGEKGKIIEKGEGGSLIIPMDDENIPPCIIQKSDGATTYATRDLARMKNWQNVHKAQIGIVIVDIAQKLHFEQVHESARKLGINKIDHIAIHFGRMSFLDEAMSTRKGKVVLLEDLLDEAEKRAFEKIESHNTDLSKEEQLELARKIGLGAIKYNVLSQNRNKNYTFDWDVMLSFDGNSAPYLQYAYTRTQSILKKVESRESRVESSKQSSIDHRPWTIDQPEEQNLLKKLLEFEHIIERSLEEFKPNTLCNYLFELSQAFSLFYNNLRIIDAETEEEISTRVKLVECFGYTLKKGLEILGIEVPERM